MPDTTQQDGSAKTRRGRASVYLALSFFAPVLILGGAFAWNMVYPFGDRQILVTDFWQQYYPFLSDYWHKLREGDSLLWSWTNGVGTNYLALIAYYLASPLNLLIVLVPHEFLREFATAMVLVKIGLSGLFFAGFLRHRFRREDLSLPLFSMFYALCAFAMGYYWNIMWLDTFALVPLVITGVSALVREGKWKLYVISLFLSVFINYYMGLFTCLFVVIMFAVFCATDGLSFREIRGRFLQIALFSLLALALTTPLTLPAFFSLQNSYSAVNSFPTTLRLNESFIDIIGNMVGFVPPTAKEGLPNLYSGVLSLTLAGVFLGNRRISRKERAIYLGIIVFLLVSCNLNVLNYIWHGFHFTNMIPYRFSFLVSFLLLYMAYKAYVLLEEGLGKTELIGMGVFCAVILLCALIGPQEGKAVAVTAAFMAFYFVMLLLFDKKQISRTAMLQAMFCIALVELASFANTSVVKVQTTVRSDYPPAYEQVQEVLEQREGDEEEFYRSEFMSVRTLNDSALYHFEGVSLFSSTANVNATYFLQNLGLMAWDSGNRYSYLETSPLADLFLNVKYLISRKGLPASGGDALWEKAGEAGDVILYRNRYHLPFGFMTRPEVLDYSPDVEDIFNSQNQLFTQATGIEGDLFLPVEVTEILTDHHDVYTNDSGDFNYVVSDRENPPEESQKWTVLSEMPQTGLLYAFVYNDGESNIEILRGEDKREIINRHPHIFACGQYEKGEKVSMTVTIEPEKQEGYVKILLAYLDQEVLEAGYEVLSGDGTFKVTQWEGHEVRGEIAVNEPGLLYLSLPYEPGWTATVDGAEQEILLLDQSMSALLLDQGTHEIVLSFVPRGLAAGGVIAGSALLAVLAIALFQRRKRSAVE